VNTPLSGFGFRVPGFRVSGFGFRVPGFRVSGFVLGVEGLGERERECLVQVTPAGKLDTQSETPFLSPNYQKPEVPTTAG